MSMTFKDIIAEMLGGDASDDVAKGIMDTMASKMKPNANVKGVMNTEEEMKLPQAIDVMRGGKTYDYDFEVDGKTEGYTFSGDGNLSNEDIQRMRDIQGITADGGMKPNVTNLGMPAPELMPGKTPTMPDVVPPGFHRMPDGTVMADGSMDYAGTGAMSPSPQIVDRTKFNTQFANLSSTEQDRVKELMSGMNDNEKAIFGAGLTGSPLNGFAVQNENFGSY